MLRFKATLVAVVAYSSSIFAEECVYETEKKGWFDDTYPNGGDAEESNTEILQELLAESSKLEVFGFRVCTNDTGVLNSLAVRIA